MAKKSHLRKHSPKAAWDIQSWLASYLNTDVDIYDFSWTIREFLADQEIESDAEYVEDLTEQQQVEFKDWLLRDSKIDNICQGQEVDCPSYLMFRDARVLPKGTWLVHFSSKYFSQFKYGSNYERLHLSTWFIKKHKVKSNNLSDEIGAAEVVFGFAFDTDQMNRIICHGHRFGKHVKLFQCDMAVEAYHTSDGYRQVIFPLGSEYNVIDLSEVYSNGNIDVELSGGDVIRVDSVSEVIDLAAHGRIEVSNYT